MDHIQIVLVDTLNDNNEICFKICPNRTLCELIVVAAKRAGLRPRWHGVLVGDTKWSLTELKNLHPNDKLVNFGVTDGYTLVIY